MKRSHLLSLIILLGTAAIFKGCGDSGTDETGSAISSTTSSSSSEVDSNSSSQQLFNAVGFSGAILNSKDGINWNTSTWNSLNYGPSKNLNGITYGGNTNLAVGWHSTIIASSDGNNWNDSSKGDLWRKCGEWNCKDKVQLSKAIYANNNFVVVGIYGTILTSPDGTTWTKRNSGVGDYLSDVTFGKDKFVVVGNRTVLTSSDLNTWTKRVNVSDWERVTPPSNFLSAANFGNNIFVVVGWSGRILTSHDGIQWTERTSGTSNNLKDVIFENGSFLVVGQSGTILSSTDGMTWSKRDSGTTKILNGVAYGNNIYVIVGDLGTILTSPDGITWTERDSGISNYLSGVTLSTSSSSTSGPSTSITSSGNSCPLDKNRASTNRSDSATGSRSSELTGRVLYVDKSALSQYQTDHYLLLDQYDSDSEYVAGTDAVDLSYAAPSLGNKFTLELRFKYDDGGYGSGQLIGSASHKAPSINFREHGARIRYGFGDNFIQVKKPDSINFDKWHHIATTFDETNYKLYLDGELINNSTAFQGLAPPEPVTLIGSSSWIGKVDEVRIWNDARTQDEIQANMNKTLVVANETGLLAYYPMAVNNNYSMIIDNSSNANHAKITNAEILSRFFDNSSCTNGPDGTSSCPYPTIRSALDEVKSGDHVYIRKGRYTELLNKRPLNVDFTKSVLVDDAFLKEEEKIIIEGYPNEEVIIDGTISLNDNNSKWEIYAHKLDNGTTISIYKTTLDFENISREIMKPVDNITQVFVSGRYMIPAMPMNFKNPIDPTTGNPNNPEPGTIWAGIGKSPFLYPKERPENPDFVSQWPNELGHDWFMPAELKYLDSPEEWAFDPQGKTLYLYPSDNYTPSSSNVRVRVRGRVLNFRAAYNFMLKNLHFFAGSLRIDGSSYWTIEDSKFSFSADMGLPGNGAAIGMHMTIRNSIFEFINDGHSWTQYRPMYPTLENVLFRNNDWFQGSCYSPSIGKNLRGPGWSDGENPPTTKSLYGASHWKYVTVENSMTCGIGPGLSALVEHSRFENLYDSLDSSGIQHSQATVRWSTSRYNWIINAPDLNGLRFDGSCGGNNGDINNFVSVGNSRGFRLKGDYYDVYHVTAYGNSKQDLSLPSYKYCGIASGGDPELGNIHSNLKNSIIGSELECNSHDCFAEGKDPITSHNGVFNPASDFTHFNSVGLWYGRLLLDKTNTERHWSIPHYELENPWAKTKGYSDERLIELYGEIPWKNRKQSYDFRPKKGSYLIDSGVVIPGINDGKDEKDEKVFLETEKPGYLNDQWRRRADTEDCTILHHPQSFSGQNRKYIGSAPDIGAYEYGDSVYWIPGFRYPHPSVPIPYDGAEDVPIDHSLVWNYPYKKDYSDTKAIVKVTRPGVNLTKEFKYPHNVLFQTFQPGGTYNWTVTVDNVSGGNWSFKVDDKIYPMNDRSVDVTDNKSLKPMQIRNLDVSTNKIAFLLFDIPSSIDENYSIKLNLVPEKVYSLNGGIGIYKYDYKGWGEKSDENNIGIIDHSLGEQLAILTNLSEEKAVSVDLTEHIKSYGEEFSIALKVLDPLDEVTFYSKEKRSKDKGGGYSHKKSVWPNLTFKQE